MVLIYFFFGKGKIYIEKSQMYKKISTPVTCTPNVVTKEVEGWREAKAAEAAQQQQQQGQTKHG